MSQDISLWQLTLTTSLMLISVGLSWWLRLGLGKDILIAGLRMTVQLLLVGFILDWVFHLAAPLPVVAIGLVMTALAAQAAASRPKQRYASITLNAFIAIFGSSFLLTGFTLTGLLHIQPWYTPQYAVPILGMILGNAVTGVALTLDRLTGDVKNRQGDIETLLSLGATRWEAAHDLLRSALRTGLMPTLNSMTVMGIVSLPGMMTGQILAGEKPQNAVRYQTAMMFVMAASSAIGNLLAAFLSYRSLFDPQGRLRVDRLKTVKK